MALVVLFALAVLFAGLGFLFLAITSTALVIGLLAQAYALFQRVRIR